MDAITATPKTRIKPLHPYKIHINSLYTYQNYLTKRPRHTRNFKVTRQSTLVQIDEHKNQEKAELKLQKALSLLKSVKRVDLSGFKVKGANLNKNRFLSCYKHSSISKISSLQWTRIQFYNKLGANFAEKPLKYLPKLHSLTYELTSKGFLNRDPIKNPCKKDPLRYLRRCPKIESLQIGASGDDSDFSKIFTGLHRYSTSLKHLAMNLNNKDGKEGFALHLENLKKLESAHFAFLGNCLIWKIHVLPNLPRLEEISLEFWGNTLPGFDLMLKKTAERKIMKKIRLIFPDYVLVDEEILKALQDFDQLTHFELKAQIQDDGMLRILSKCLENMKQLKDLRLTLSRLSQSFDHLNILGQKINELQSLRHLHLSFLPTETPNFIQDCGLIYLETLSLIYPQLDPIQSLLDLAVALRISAGSLRKLRISFGSFSPNQHRQPLILELLSSLSNLQVLEMIGLDITNDNFLGRIVRVICSLKDLRELTFGEIKGQVTPSAYEHALRAILSKRGLERFECKTSDSLLESCGISNSPFSNSNPCQIDMEIIERKNPFLESLKISDKFFVVDLLAKVIRWS